MRSQLVFTANGEVENRFLLATIAMRATRRLHIDSTRTEHTLNKVLVEIGKGHFTSAEMPESPQLPAVEETLFYLGG